MQYMRPPYQHVERVVEVVSERARSGDIHADVDATGLERAGDGPQRQVWPDLVVDGVEGKDQVELVRSIESGCVVLLKSHIAQPVTLGHQSRGAQRGRLSKFEADEPAGRIPPGEETSWAPHPHPTSATSIPAPSRLDPGSSDST